MRVLADPDRLAQIVGILVGNASKFTPPSGELRVSAAVRDDAVEIVVADTGPGIEPGMQPQLFDLFDRDPDAGGDAPQGLGTGLAIDYALFVISRFREELALLPEDDPHASAKAMRELGYQPRPVRLGIREALRWFQEEGMLPRDRPLTPRGVVG